MHLLFFGCILSIISLPLHLHIYSNTIPNNNSLNFSYMKDHINYQIEMPVKRSKELVIHKYIYISIYACKIRNSSESSSLNHEIWWGKIPRKHFTSYQTEPEYKNFA